MKVKITSDNTKVRILLFSTLIIGIFYVLYFVSQIILINSLESANLSILELKNINFSTRFSTFFIFSIILFTIITTFSELFSYLYKKIRNINDIDKILKTKKYMYLTTTVISTLYSKHILIFAISFLGYGFIPNIEVRKDNTNEVLESGDLILQNNHTITIKSTDGKTKVYYTKGNSVTGNTSL